MLTQAQLKSLLRYEPETGQFFWHVSGKGRRADLRAGTTNNFGYNVIMIQLERYVASRLAWLYMTGEWPKEEIDHINRAKGDDRWSNLREASRAENAANQGYRDDNTSGHPGVCWDSQKLKWKVQIGPANARVQKHFVSFDEACSFYRQKALELFGEFASAEKVL